jgi:ribonuclease D
LADAPPQNKTKKDGSALPQTLTTTEALAAFCARAALEPYVTVDTEFLRERTYFAQLCLVQMALPGEDEADAVLIDPLAEGMSLEPLYELFRNEAVIKVFHAARQDLEIFHVDGNVMPRPLFDTQVAAMVCGFGEQVGYETLVRKIARASLDKSSRFTDWSRRPLSEAQKNYALADVTHLRQIYEHLAAELSRTGRTAWMEEELTTLTDHGNYVVDPENAWRRVKTRTNSGKFLAVLKELARFREDTAQSRNIPRNRIMKDDVLLELASTKPRSVQDLSKSRLLLREARKGDIADGILAAVERGLEMNPADHPKFDKAPDRSSLNPALADLLRVLLKAKAEEAGVAQKLIASSADLDDIACGGREGLWAHGWRFEVFGEDALRLCNSEIALSAKGQRVKIIKLH